MVGENAAASSVVKRRCGGTLGWRNTLKLSWCAAKFSHAHGVNGAQAHVWCVPFLCDDEEVRHAVCMRDVHVHAQHGDA